MFGPAQARSMNRSEPRKLHSICSDRKSCRMDIFNRQPSVAEDTIQYSIYPPTEVADKASVTALAACITDFVNSTLPNFIWHRDAFEVKLVSNPDNAGSWILEGRMRVGDCIDDEWCIVWLLTEVSSKWDIVVKYVQFSP